jgi:hypothetical protein
MSMIIRSPLEAWEKLKTQGGIELDDRDEGLDQAILRMLDPQAASLEAALDNATMDEFTRAFFAAIEPYVQMFRGILKFFEQANATEGKEQIVLRVDEIDISLEHFRSFLATWTQAAKMTLTVTAVDRSGLWEMLSVMRQQPKVEKELDRASGSKSSKPQIGEDVQRWLDARDMGDEYLPVPPSLAQSGCPAELARAAQVANVFIERLRGRKLTPSKRERVYRANLQSPRCRLNAADGFDFWTVLQEESDHWSRTALICLSAATTVLMPSELQSMGDALAALLDQYPLRTVDAAVSLEDLESILSLPIWDKRYELYSVWIATEIVRALNEQRHQVELHHEKGRIEFAFKETVIATVRSSTGPFRLISEKRSPLRAPPRGESRKENIQPDHGLWTSDPNRNDLCRMVIEVKHYKRSSKRKFVDVFEDYAAALPQAEIYLVNHGSVGNAQYEVSRGVQSRCHGIGELNATNREARQQLVDAVQRCVGPPIPAWPAMDGKGQSMAGGVVFAIDVSGSMRETLRDPAVNAIARALATEERPSKIVAVDTSVVGTWDISEDGFQSALNAGGGATELQQPVRELLTQFGSVVLFTDSDGLTSLGDVPYSQYPNTNGTGSAVTIVRCQPIAAEGS